MDSNFFEGNFFESEAGIEKTVALYVHIPFCVKKCDYCDFFSVPCGKCSSNGFVPDSYIDSLIFEAQFLKNHFKTENFSTIYIGGGTPSLLTSSQIEKLLSELKKLSKNIPLEITIEANPQDITKEFLNACENAGVNRLSVGFQSFSDDALQAVGRRTTRSDNFSALELIEKNWKGSLGADLIAGLPFETEKTFFEGLEILTSKKSINHISLYSLCVEEGTPLYKKIEHGEISYDFDKTDDFWISGRDFLESRGFFQYEVSNFARSEREEDFSTQFKSRHNMTYWKQNPYFGLGSGGCSTVGNVRFTGTNDIEKFVALWRDFSISLRSTRNDIVLKKVFDIEELSEKTREFEFLMLGFRTLEGVSCSEYEKRYGKKLVSRLNENDNLFEKWISDGRATLTERGGEVFAALTKKGILFLNAFLSEL